MVSQMRGIRLSEELKRVQELLEAAEIKFVGEEAISLDNVSLLIENILSMCLKEAVTNVVKHSQATVLHDYFTSVCKRSRHNGRRQW